MTILNGDNTIKKTHFLSFSVQMLVHCIDIVQHISYTYI